MNRNFLMMAFLVGLATLAGSCGHELRGDLLGDAEEEQSGSGTGPSLAAADLNREAGLPAVPRLFATPLGLVAGDATDFDQSRMEASEAPLLSLELREGVLLRAEQSGALRAFEDLLSRPYILVFGKDPSGTDSVLVLSPESALLPKISAGEAWPSDLLKLPLEGPDDRTLYGEDFALIDAYLKTF